MQLLNLAAFLLPAAFAAAAKTSGLCTKSTSVVNALQNPTGSSFCASLLKIPQTTVTTTSTRTPSPFTVTRTTRVTDTTATVTSTLTHRSTTTVTNLFTAQSTDSTTVSTAVYSATAVQCISDTDQLAPYTTTTVLTPSTAPSFAPSSAPSSTPEREEEEEEEEEDAALEKRSAAPSALKGQSKRRRKAFCSCLLPITPGTITSTHKVTIARPTSTVTFTNTVSAKSVVHTAVTTTVTRSIRSTTTLDPVTSTVVVAVVTPTPSVYAGVSYYAFENDYNYNLASPGFDATTWNSNDWQVSGTIQEINDEHTDDYPSGASTCTLPDGNVVDFCTQVTFVNQGYFHAVEDGAYTIGSDNTIDNGMYVWSGSAAYDSYNDGNEDYNAERSGSGITTGSQNYNLNAGDLVPFTVMNVNGGGPGRADIYVVTPDGNSYGTDGFFIPACPANSPFSP